MTRIIVVATLPKKFICFQILLPNMEEEEDNTLKISMNNFRERLFYIFYRYWENDQLTDLEFR